MNRFAKKAEIHSYLNTLYIIWKGIFLVMTL